MKKIHLLLIIVTSILLNCNNDDCGACFTPPEGFLFELIDKTTGENVFTNGTYEPQQLKIIDTITNTTFEYSFISENDINLIQIGSIGWKTEVVHLEFQLSGQSIFQFDVDAKRQKGKCCSHTEYNDISIINADFERNTENGIYRVFLE